jgi:signal transduction histidine kinase
VWDIASVLLAKTLKSSTFKIALIAIGTFGAIVSMIFTYVYLSTASYVRSRSDRAITADYLSLREAYARSGRAGLLDLIRERMDDKRFAANVYALADPSSRLLGGNLSRWPSPPADAAGWTEFRATAPLADAAGPPLVRGMIETLPGGERLLVGRDIGDLDHFAAQIRLAVISSVILIFLLAAMASVLVTRRTVGRIEQINATSRAIMQSGLDQRIPLRGSNDEWDSVAENLNLMLDRIETLMGEIKQVSDNVAHDLRTPLTRMRGRLETAYHGKRAAEADQLLIGDTIADLDSVLRIFSSLTRIAQIEGQARTDAFRTVNLVEIAGEVVELYDAAAEQDDTHLNAIKHGRNGGHVAVRVENTENGPLIAIADDGPGIPACEREHVFKRFYRLEQSRYTPGNGLGLSLVAAVARLHHARIEMRDNAPGLTFELWFAAPSTEPAMDLKG